MIRNKVYVENAIEIRIMVYILPSIIIRDLLKVYWFHSPSYEYFAFHIKTI